MSAALLPAIQHPAPATAVVARWNATWQPLARSVALLLAGLAVGLLLRSFGPVWIRPLFAALSLNQPFAVAAIFAATAVSVVAHELGHLLAASWLNFAVLGISLGPVRVRWLHGKYSVRFSAKRLFAGSITAVPKDMRNWRGLTMCVVAAGPLATLLTGFAACAVVVLNPVSGFQQTFWCALVQLNFLIFILGLAPNGANANVRSDATLFRALFRNGPDADELELVHLIGQLKLHAIRPSDYPELFVDRVAIFRAGHPDTKVLAARTMSDWALDRGDIRMADDWDREAIAQTAHCDPRLRNSALAASACFDVVFRSDVKSARAKFAGVDLDELFPPCFAHRARATRLLAMDLPHLAPAEIIRGQYALPLGLAYYDFERMLLEKVHMQALASSLPGMQECVMMASKG